MGAMGRHHSFWELSMKMMTVGTFAAMSVKAVEDLLRRQDIVLTRKGKPVAVVTPPGNAALKTTAKLLPPKKK